MAESPADLDVLDLDDLKRLVVQLVEEIAALRAENVVLREKIARLKDRPRLRPSGMAKKAAQRRKAKAGRKQARGGRGAKRLAIDEAPVIAAPHPPGARFKSNVLMLSGFREATVVAAGGL
jgi:hypothetical protein